LLPFTAIMAAGLASRWLAPPIESSLHRGNSRGSPTRTPQQADPATAPARPGRPRRRPDPPLLHHPCPAHPRPPLPPAPPPAHPPLPPPARGPALPHRHGHRAITPSQEPPDLPRAPRRHRRVGRAARPRTPRVVPGSVALAQRRSRRSLPRPPLRCRHPHL